MIKDTNSSTITLSEDAAAFTQLVDTMYAPCAKDSPVNEKSIDLLSGEEASVPA